MKPEKNLAIVGIGQWGKNLLREFSKIANVCFCYHRGDLENLSWLKRNYPNLKVATYYNQILRNKSIDAVAIATPIETHYGLARQALMAGKHVFVEKPITANVAQAQKLVKLAAKQKLVLFVGHIFSYHPVAVKIKSIMRREPIKYASFVWNKFGTFGEKLIYNLASHDVAMALDLFGQPSGIKVLEKRGLVTGSDIVYIRLNFNNHRSCSLYINRVSNLKNKTVTLVLGKSIYFWEHEQLFKLDKKTNTFKQIYKNNTLPLEIECREFIKCITQNKKPFSDSGFGLAVIKILSKI